MSTDFLNRRMDLWHSISGTTNILTMDTSYPVKLAGKVLKLFIACNDYKKGRNWELHNTVDELILSIESGSVYDFAGRVIDNNIGEELPYKEEKSVFAENDYVMAIIDFDNKNVHLCSQTNFGNFIVDHSKGEGNLRLYEIDGEDGTNLIDGYDYNISSEIFDAATEFESDEDDTHAFVRHSDDQVLFEIPEKSESDDSSIRSMIPVADINKLNINNVSCSLLNLTFPFINQESFSEESFDLVDTLISYILISGSVNDKFISDYCFEYDEVTKNPIYINSGYSKVYINNINEIDRTKYYYALYDYEEYHKTSAICSTGYKFLPILKNGNSFSILLSNNFNFKCNGSNVVLSAKFLGRNIIGTYYGNYTAPHIGFSVFNYDNNVSILKQGTNYMDGASYYYSSDLNEYDNNFTKNHPIDEKIINICAFSSSDDTYINRFINNFSTSNDQANYLRHLLYNIPNNTQNNYIGFNEYSNLTRTYNSGNKRYEYKDSHNNIIEVEYNNLDSDNNGTITKVIKINDCYCAYVYEISEYNAPSDNINGSCYIAKKVYFSSIDDDKCFTDDPSELDNYVGYNADPIINDAATLYIITKTTETKEEIETTTLKLFEENDMNDPIYSKISTSSKEEYYKDSRLIRKIENNMITEITEITELTQFISPTCAVVEYPEYFDSTDSYFNIKDGIIKKNVLSDNTNGSITNNNKKLRTTKRYNIKSHNNTRSLVYLIFELGEKNGYPKCDNYSLFSETSIIDGDSNVQIVSNSKYVYKSNTPITLINTSHGTILYNIMTRLALAKIDYDDNGSKADINHKTVLIASKVKDTSSTDGLFPFYTYTDTEENEHTCYCFKHSDSEICPLLVYDDSDSNNKTMQYADKLKKYMYYAKQSDSTITVYRVKIASIKTDGSILYNTEIIINYNVTDKTTDGLFIKAYYNYYYNNGYNGNEDDLITDITNKVSNDFIELSVSNATTTTSLTLNAMSTGIRNIIQTIIENYHLYAEMPNTEKDTDKLIVYYNTIKYGNISSDSLLYTNITAANFNNADNYNNIIFQAATMHDYYWNSADKDYYRVARLFNNGYIFEQNCASPYVSSITKNGSYVYNINTYLDYIQNHDISSLFNTEEFKYLNGTGIKNEYYYGKTIYDFFNYVLTIKDLSISSDNKSNYNDINKNMIFFKKENINNIKEIITSNSDGEKYFYDADGNEYTLYSDLKVENNIASDNKYGYNESNYYNMTKKDNNNNYSYSLTEDYKSDDKIYISSNNAGLKSDFVLSLNTGTTLNPTLISLDGSLDEIELNKLNWRNLLLALYNNNTINILSDSIINIKTDLNNYFYEQCININDEVSIKEQTTSDTMAKANKDTRDGSTTFDRQFDDQNDEYNVQYYKDNNAEFDENHNIYQYNYGYGYNVNSKSREINNRGVIVLVSDGFSSVINIGNNNRASDHSYSSAYGNIYPKRMYISKDGLICTKDYYDREAADGTEDLATIKELQEQIKELQEQIKELQEN